MIVNTTLYYFFSTVAQSVAALIGLFSIFIFFTKEKKNQAIITKALSMIRCLKGKPEHKDINLVIGKLYDFINSEAYLAIPGYINATLTKSSNADIKECAKKHFISSRLTILFSNDNFLKKRIFEILFVLSMFTILLCLVSIPFIEFISDQNLLKNLLVGIVIILIVIIFSILASLTIKIINDSHN